MRFAASTTRISTIALLVHLLMPAHAHADATLRQCKRACTDDIRRCVASGGTRAACRADVLARCEQDGLQVCRASLSGLAVPSAPSTPSAVATSPTSIHVAWTDTNTAETGYGIERSNDPVLYFVTVGTTGRDATAYDDTTVSSGVTYYYRVRALGRKGTMSMPSAVVSATTPDVIAPSAPTGLKAFVIDCTHVALTWSGSTDVGTGMAGYRLYRNGAFLGATSAAWAYDLTSEGTTVVYDVTAVDVAGNESAPSAGATLTTPACGSTSTTSSSTTSTTSSTTSTSVARATTTSSTSTSSSTSRPPTTIVTTSTSTSSTSTSRPSTTTSSSTSTSRSTSTSTSSSTSSSRSTTSTSSTSSTTLAPDQPPAANAGPDQMGQTLVALSFSGAGSADPDGSIVSYAWAFGDGSTGAGMAMTHSYRSAGTYVATLTVTDDRGMTGRDTATVTVLNRAPSANAGADRTGSVGSAVAFDGSGSSDADGSIASYAWSFGDGGTATGASVSHAYAAAGTYVATLTVTDDKGATGSDTATVTITAGGGTFAWARAAGAAGDDRGNAVAIAGDGSTVLAGHFLGTVDFGTGPLTSALASPVLGPSQDMFIAKYAANGTPLWSRRFGDDAAESARGVAIDGGGNVLLTGLVSSYFIDLGTGVQTTVANGEAFIAKYGPDGTALWARIMGGIGADAGNAVAVDGTGNVFVAGCFADTVDFGSGALTSAGGSDAFVAKYSATGTPLWARRFGSTDNDIAYGVATDRNGDVIVTGEFIGSVDFGTGTRNAAGGRDAFVAKYAGTNGAPLWVKTFGAAGDDYGRAVATDGNGDVVVTGHFQGSIDLGGSTLAASATDIFVARYTSAGTLSWAKRFGGTSDDFGFGVTVDGSGNAVVTGYFQGTVDFGGGVLSAAGPDVFVAKYTAAGAHVWSKRFGGASSQVGAAVAANASGAIAATGYFQGTVDFGGGPLTSAGAYDAFVVRLAP